MLIDTPPSLRFLTSAALIASTHLIVPVEACDAYALHGLTRLTKLIEQVRQVNPSLSVLGGLLTRYDKRQTVCKLIEGATLAQLGALLPVQIASSCKVQESFTLRLSVNEHDRTCKVSRAYVELASVLAQTLKPRGGEDTMARLLTPMRWIVCEARFQIEFLFRDAKQHTGLGHSQVLDSKGQEHFANSSLTALNLLRLEDHAWALSRGLKLRERVGSIGSLKLHHYNDLILNRFISTLGGELKLEKIKRACEQAYQTGLLVA